MYCIFYMWRINFNNCILLVLRGTIQFPHVTWSFALLSPYHVVWGNSVVPQFAGYAPAGGYIPDAARTKTYAKITFFGRRR